MYISGVESDVNADEEEEKQRLISQVLELQNTLDGGSQAPHLNFVSISLLYLFSYSLV